MPTTEDSVAKRIDFLNVFHSRDLKGLVADGLLGLGPKSSPKQPSETFVEELKRQGVITESTYSMYLSDFDKELACEELEKGEVIECLKRMKSKVWFGGYDASFIR